MTHLRVIYDTSWLMGPKRSIIRPRVSGLQLRSRMDFRDSFMRWVPEESHIVPSEVKAELATHLSAGEKSMEARSARGLLVEILRLDTCQELSLADIKAPAIHQAKLGPDSTTDKKMIGLALELLAESPDNLVFLATNDGGIELELAHLWAQEGLRVYSPSTWLEFTIECVKRSISDLREFVSSIEALEVAGQKLRQEYDIQEARSFHWPDGENLWWIFGAALLVAIFFSFSLFLLVSFIGLCVFLAIKLSDRCSSQRWKALQKACRELEATRAKLSEIGGPGKWVAARFDSEAGTFDWESAELDLDRSNCLAPP